MRRQHRDRLGVDRERRLGAFVTPERATAAGAEERSLDRIGDGILDLDRLAEELRGAQAALGELTGELTSDDLLGEIFATFCIGK
jgi:tRNA modification GTPase